MALIDSKGLIFLLREVFIILIALQYASALFIFLNPPDILVLILIILKSLSLGLLSKGTLKSYIKAK